MGPSRYPAELTDRIIDFCHDDQNTLSNCALTHSSWLPASRLHLFHTITSSLADEQRTGRADQLPSIINYRPPEASKQWPSILPYIKTVEIAPLGSHQFNNAPYLAHTIQTLCSSEGLPSPSVYVNLTRVRSGTGDSLTASLSQVNDVVTRLKLLTVTFFSANNVWPFLSSFPRLQHLELSGVGFFRSTKYSPPSERIFDGIPLSTIWLSTAFMGLIISGLTSVVGSLPLLEDFGIVYQDVKQEELPQLADGIQGTVKCLRFSASCYPGDRRVAEFRPSESDIRIPEFVGRFRSLNSLVLDNLVVHGSSGYRKYDQSFQWIPGVLQQLSSPIRRLAFEVTATSNLQLKRIPWESIDKIVTPEAPQFKELVRVDVLVKRGAHQKNSPSSIHRDAVLVEIVRRLPVLNLLGLLRCDTKGC